MFWCTLMWVGILIGGTAAALAAFYGFIWLVVEAPSWLNKLIGLVLVGALLVYGAYCIALRSCGS